MVFVIVWFVFFYAFCSVLMSAYSKLGSFFHLFLPLTRPYSNVSSCDECVNTPKYWSLVYVPANSMTKNWAQNAKKQIDKQEKGRSILLCVSQSSYFQHSNIHSLSSSMVIISRSFSLVHARMCGIHKQNKGFFEINEWHWLFSFWKETIRSYISFAAHFASIHFISFIHSLRRFFSTLSLVLIIASRRHNTCGNRSAFALANFSLIARVRLFECGRFEWQKCRNQTNYEHVFFYFSVH